MMQTWIATEIEPQTAANWTERGTIRPVRTTEENTFYVDELDREFTCKNYPEPLEWEKGFHLYSINRANGYNGDVCRAAIVYDRATDSLLEVHPHGFHTIPATAIQHFLKTTDQSTPATFH